MGNLIPNSFQVPNVYIDRLMPLLTDSEFRVLMFAVRHILGWQDTIGGRAARLSLSAFEHGYRGSNGVGMGRAAIVKALEGLEHFGVLRRVGEPTRSGQMWELGETIDWEGLKKRRSERRMKNKRRTQSAVSARAGAVRATNQETGTSDVPESGMSDIPAVRATNRKNGTCDEPKTGTSDVPNKTHKKPKEQKPISGLTHVSQTSPDPGFSAVAAVPDERSDNTDKGGTNAPAPVAAAAAGTKVGSEREKKSAGAESDDPVAELVNEAAGLQNDEALGRVYGAYMDEIGKVTATMRRIIADAVREYGAESVLSAIREAAVYNVRKWSYIKAILERKAGEKNSPRQRKSNAALRQTKLAWLREQGVTVQEDIAEKELDSKVLEAAGWDGAIFMRLENFARLNAAAGR